MEVVGSIPTGPTNLSLGEASCQVYYKAREIALTNGMRYHIAALLWRGKRLVYIGKNSYKTHPAFGRTYEDGSSAHCMHAEMDAIRFAQPGDRLEIVRFTKSSDKFFMAKPCKHCMEHILSANFKSVRYTNKDGQWILL